MKKIYSPVRGFTLIELLVVIAIIVLLTGIILTSIISSRVKARDAERVSDLNQIQLSIEQYFDRCGQYPTSIVITENNGCPTSPTAITLGSFISKVPVDPSANQSYGYATNVSTGNSYPTDYILHATFEASNAASQNSLVGTFYGFTCDASTNYCIGPK